MSETTKPSIEISVSPYIGPRTATIKSVLCADFAQRMFEPLRNVPGVADVQGFAESFRLELHWSSGFDHVVADCLVVILRAKKLTLENVNVVMSGPLRSSKDEVRRLLTRVLVLVAYSMSPAEPHVE